MCTNLISYAWPMFFQGWSRVGWLLQTHANPNAPQLSWWELPVRLSAICLFWTAMEQFNCKFKFRCCVHVNIEKQHMRYFLLHTGSIDTLISSSRNSQGATTRYDDSSCNLCLVTCKPLKVHCMVLMPWQAVLLSQWSLMVMPYCLCRFMLYMIMCQSLMWTSALFRLYVSWTVWLCQWHKHS